MFLILIHETKMFLLGNELHCLINLWLTQNLVNVNVESFRVSKVRIQTVLLQDDLGHAFVNEQKVLDPKIINKSA